MPDHTKQLFIGDREYMMTGDLEDPYFLSLEAFHNDHPQLEHWVAKNLASDSVVIDAGGNIGLTALILSHFCPQGHVYVFEAIPRNATFLRRNIELNEISNCTVIASALGAEVGEISFFEQGASSQVVTTAHLDAANRPATPVPLTTLDTFMDQSVGLSRLDFIKLDVEGFEPPVLHGGARLIERFRPPIFMEFNSWCLSFAHGFSAFGFAQALWDAFEVAAVDPSGETCPAGDGTCNGFLYENAVLHGAVDDVLLRLKPEGKVPRLPESISSPNEIRLLRELEQAGRQLQAMHASTSWRLTRPIRTLKQKLSGR